MAEWIKNKTPIYAAYKTHFRIKDTQTKSEEKEKKMFHANGNQKEAGVAILISDKTDFKTDCNKRQRRALHNDKGTSVSGKHERRKGPTKTNPKQLRKCS